MIVNIEQKIEKWKNKLLDLGKRNRLLNYRETKRSNLQILSPDCISLWNSFVKNEKPLEFPAMNAACDLLISQEKAKIIDGKIILCK